ncbi:hypothetical protein FOM92_07325 [Sphingorhabdus contaminans]|uniref:PAS domain-containing protein n=2 Tax=Sphingorhabdus contaminans TaxID=1343899 RepID=A0A553WLA9_9SPHN|nr:hypothetical protein [Sphingorhabdus contaminans]TSB05461.1 hypothetical protein FOM92_07325 [Sphingorhabdus contaminans]
MDNLRGFEPYGSDYQADVPGYAVFDDEDAAIEAPPVVSTDERRMQVRAYNFWTAQLNDKNYPSIEELDPAAVEDFRDYSVLLDFTSGIENPSIEYLGEKLRSECGLSDDVTYLDQVPSRSLLSRITDHYLQIIANRAPIGFEAEFINDRGVNIMYRGILLPYSSDDDTIDFIYGVINWKEAVAIEIAAPLQLEVEQALAAAPPRQEHVPVWADGPTAGHLDDVPEDEQFADELELDEAYALAEPQPDENSSLADWLDAARQSADSARDADMRTREALYQAIGRAHDFALVAAKYPADYAELLSDAGLVAQERAKFTPIVKLVFGVGYDKTRLTEFATALQFADRNAVPMGGLAEILSKHEGGLKGVIAAERRAKKVAAGQHVAQAAVDPRSRLRTARARDLSEFAGSGEEFVLLVARRDADGNVAIVGAVDADAALTEKALRKTAV